MDAKNKIFFKEAKYFGPGFIMIAAFLWTLDAFFREGLTRYFASLQIVFLEHLIIMVVILPLIIRYLPELRQFTPKEWGALIFIGWGGSALATVALTESFKLGVITMTVLLQQTQPFIAIALAYLFLKERIPKGYYTLAFLATIGVFLIFFPFLTNYTEDPRQFLVVITNAEFLIRGTLPGILALIAAFFWGGSTVFGRYLLEHSEKKLEFSQMTTYRFFSAFLFLTVLNILLIVTGTPFPRSAIILANFFPLLFIALIVGLLSLTLYYFGLKNTHATVSTICELFYPLSAFVILPLLLNETIFTSQIIGGIILIIASGTLSFLYARYIIDQELRQQAPTIASTVAGG